MSREPKKIRDHLMVKVINGATKSSVHIDHKKEDNKKKAREKININEEIEESK